MPPPNLVFESPDDTMAAIYRNKTPGERLRVAFGNEFIKTCAAGVCGCTLGWQEAAYSIVIGKPVTAEIEETVLGGGSRCSFRIGVNSNNPAPES